MAANGQASAGQTERWAAERLEFGKTDEHRTRWRAWYADYKAWATGNGEPLLDPKQAATVLRQSFRGVHVYAHNGIVYGGMKLAPRP